MQSPRRPAFTLVELMVVISIVAMLCVLILPALKHARTTAHMSKSLPNIRQITLSHMMYANDNKSHLIPRMATHPTTSAVTWPVWTFPLYNGHYINSVEIFWSPARDLRTVDHQAMRSRVVNSTTRPYWERPGYGVNEWIMPHKGEGIETLRLGDPRNPPSSKVLIMAEVWNMSANIRAGMSYCTPNYGTRSIGPAIFTYNGRAARSYLDGHASGSAAQDIGWIPSDQYMGKWSYSSASSYLGKAPWYRQWQEYY